MSQLVGVDVTINQPNPIAIRKRIRPPLLIIYIPSTYIIYLHRAKRVCEIVKGSMSRGRIKLAGGSSRMPDLVELVAAGRSVRPPPRPLVAQREEATVMLVVFRAGGGFLRLGMGREGGMVRVSRHRERVIHDSIPRGCARRVPCPAPALLPWRSAGRPRKYLPISGAASDRPPVSTNPRDRTGWTRERVAMEETTSKPQDC